MNSIKYVNERMSCENLENDKTIELIDKYRKGDFEAGRQIVNSYMNFIIKKVKNFRAKTIDATDDTLSHAIIGMYNAMKTFDKKKKCVFATYANRAIYMTIIREYRRYKNQKLHGKIKNIIFSASDFVYSDELNNVNYKHNIDCIGIDFDDISKCLNDREKSIIFDRFYNGLNYRELSKKNEICIERARQIVEESLDKMRDALKINS